MQGLAQKCHGAKRQAKTGSAGALARYEREARNSYSVKKFEIECVRRFRRARAPALPVPTGSFLLGSTFWAKPMACMDFRFILATRLGSQIMTHFNR